MGVAKILKGGAGLAADVLSRIANRSSGLLILTVRLLFRSGETIVCLELTTGAGRSDIPVGGEPDGRHGQWSWDVPYRAFSAAAEPDAAAADSDVPRLAVPDCVAGDLRYRIALARVPANQPLWLKLARPYGVLGTASWEHDLGVVLERPVLRLPDFPERPVERPDVLENAVVVDADRDVTVTDLVRRVDAVVQAVLYGSGRTATRVHIFAAARWHAPLRSLSADRRVLVHDPSKAQTAREASRAEQRERKQPLRSAAWSNWVVETLGARGLDAIHLISRAYWTEAGAQIILSCSPSPKEDEAALVAVDLDEFALLVNRAGAWAVTMTPPSPSRVRDLAFVADHFAHLRPGAVLFSPLSDVQDHTSLKAACRLLFSGKPSQAPVLGSAFVHCHPGFVKGEDQSAIGELSDVLAKNAHLLAQRAPLGERLSGAIANLLPGKRNVEVSAPAAWVGAMQRFLESAVFEEVRRSAGDVLLSKVQPSQSKPGEQSASVNTGAQTTLAAIQNIVDKYVEKSGR